MRNPIWVILPGERAALAHDHVADGQPIEGPAIDGHDVAHVGDVRGRSHAPRPSSTGTSPRNLEERRELLVLGPRAWRRRFSAVEPVVLRFERPVIAPQLVDPATAPINASELDADRVDRVLRRESANAGPSGAP